MDWLWITSIISLFIFFGTIRVRYMDKQFDTLYLKFRIAQKNIDEKLEKEIAQAVPDKYNVFLLVSQIMTHTHTNRNIKRLSSNSRRNMLIDVLSIIFICVIVAMDQHNLFVYEEWIAVMIACFILSALYAGMTFVQTYIRLTRIKDQAMDLED